MKKSLLILPTDYKNEIASYKKKYLPKAKPTTAVSSLQGLNHTCHFRHNQAGAETFYISTVYREITQQLPVAMPHPWRRDTGTSVYFLPPDRRALPAVHSTAQTA